MAGPLVLAAAAALLLALQPSLNRDAFAWLNTLGRPPGAGTFWLMATLAGDTLVIVALAIALVRHRPLALQAVPLTLVIAAAMVHAVKPLAAAARPVAVLGLQSVHVLGPVLTKASFPSGHTATAFAGAALVVLSGPLASRRARLMAALALVAALLIGLSRSVVGAHWPVDVAAGAGIGWFGAWAALQLTARMPEAPRRWLGRLGVLLAAGCWVVVVTGVVPLLR